MLRRKPAQPPAPEPNEATQGARKQQRVTARRVHDVWHVDITVVPILFGFWVPWFPFSLPTRWPFSWHVAAVLEHLSRAPLATGVFAKEPTSSEICTMLDAAIDQTGRPPRYIISDQGSQFGTEYRAWCSPHGVKPRFGAIGKSGSIAIIERFFRSLKSECCRVMLVPLSLEAMAREIALYAEWYRDHRPHQGLGGRTPGEVLADAVPERERPRIETRERWRPAARGDPPAELRLRVSNVDLVVTRLEGRSHLPVVSLRVAA